MKAILLENPDGTVSVRGGFGPGFLALFNNDRDAALAYVINNLVSTQNPGAVARIIEHTDIPQDRTFRNAWKASGSVALVDMPKAREIQKERLRELRIPILKAADVEYMLALETDDKTAQAAIIAKKQALRDVTDDPAIAGANTPDELKAVLPEVLR